MPEVRLIDEEGQQVGIVKTAEALAMARQRDVDLVEVAAQAAPPVARLMDYGRYKYEQSKRDKEARKHQQSVQLREVRMKPKIDEHDIDFKTRTAEKLLKQGEKVKVTVMFRAREITHPQIGKKLLDRIRTRLEEVGIVEKDPTLEGRHMSMVLAPDKKKLAALAKKKAEEQAQAEQAADGKSGAEAPEDSKGDEPLLPEDDQKPEVREDDEQAAEVGASERGE